VALVVAVVVGGTLAVEVATDELLLVATEIDACCVIVTVFDPLDPHPVTTTTSANPVNAPIVLVTIGSLYTEQLTGRFQS
jgi:hypothetical protein